MNLKKQVHLRKKYLVFKHGMKVFTEGLAFKKAKANAEYVMKAYLQKKGIKPTKKLMPFYRCGTKRFLDTLTATFPIIVALKKQSMLTEAYIQLREKLFQYNDLFDVFDMFLHLSTFLRHSPEHIFMWVELAVQTNVLHYLYATEQKREENKQQLIEFFDRTRLMPLYRSYVNEYHQPKPELGILSLFTEQNNVPFQRVIVEITRFLQQHRYLPAMQPYLEEGSEYAIYLQWLLNPQLYDYENVPKSLFVLVELFPGERASAFLEAFNLKYPVLSLQHQHHHASRKNIDISETYENQTFEIDTFCNSTFARFYDYITDTLFNKYGHQFSNELKQFLYNEDLLKFCTSMTEFDRLRHKYRRFNFNEIYIEILARFYQYLQQLVEGIFQRPPFAFALPSELHGIFQLPVAYKTLLNDALQRNLDAFWEHAVPLFETEEKEHYAFLVWNCLLAWKERRLRTLMPKLVETVKYVEGQQYTINEFLSPLYTRITDDHGHLSVEEVLSFLHNLVEANYEVKQYQPFLYQHLAENFPTFREKIRHYLASIQS